jgi:hypothetical protein
MKKVIILIIAVVFAATAAQAAEPYGGKRNYMTFSLGGFWPGQDLDDEGFKTGPDFNFSYVRAIQTWFGFGAGVHTYGAGSNTAAVGIGNSDFGSLGIEMAFYVQPNHWAVQPYIGFGPAIYYNYLEYEIEINEDKADESGVGLGWFAKVGLRAFLTKRFFGGMSLKGFSNYWDLDVIAGRDETYNFGGGVFAFELGFTF